MRIVVSNEQREARVNVRQLSRLARCAARRLAIRQPGILSIALISTRRMRRLNQRFLGHDRSTDVLSFRYDDAFPLPRQGRHARAIGDIVIAPREARVYAKRHGIPYDEELARYVVHGLLHWLGHEDRTLREQRAMRVREDALLDACGLLVSA